MLVKVRLKDIENSEIKSLKRELSSIKEDMEKAIECLARKCAYLEFIEGGMSYCSLTDRGCDDCQSMWRVIDCNSK